MCMWRMVGGWVDVDVVGVCVCMCVCPCVHAITEVCSMFHLRMLFRSENFFFFLSIISSVLCLCDA